jgi:hypothetical protein
MAGLGRCLHERGRDPSQLLKRRRAPLGRFAGGLTCLVEERRRLLDAARDCLRDGRLAEGERIVGMGVEESSGRAGGFGELLGREFELRLRGQQAGLAGMLLGQPLHLVECGRNLVAFDEPVELFEVTDELAAAELDLLAGATGTRGVAVNGHRRLLDRGSLESSWNVPEGRGCGSDAVGCPGADAAAYSLQSSVGRRPARKTFPRSPQAP